MLHEPYPDYEVMMLMRMLMVFKHGICPVQLHSTDNRMYRA
ncbi:hypothetical protein DFP94_10728 [Fontibacillus phaseoli]|uniref:Uncharacterized protein n=1 Tax=Fontibacillus phaseoli TaxID=1416533 RepID=A0A369B9S9_9BACL|nr:hypothetical protein DFP94_10728 [Fontibacillus phaseoli]